MSLPCCAAAVKQALEKVKRVMQLPMFTLSATGQQAPPPASLPHPTQPVAHPAAPAAAAVAVPAPAKPGSPGPAPAAAPVAPKPGQNLAHLFSGAGAAAAGAAPAAAEAAPAAAAEAGGPAAVEVVPPPPAPSAALTAPAPVPAGLNEAAMFPTVYQGQVRERESRGQLRGLGAWSSAARVGMDRMPTAQRCLQRSGVLCAWGAGGGACCMGMRAELHTPEAWQQVEIAVLPVVPIPPLEVCKSADTR
jgi:hypothetical protein